MGIQVGNLDTAVGDARTWGVPVPGQAHVVLVVICCCCLLEIKCVWFPSFPVPLAHDSLLIWRGWLFPAPALDKPQLHISPPLGRKDSARQCWQEDGEPPREDTESTGRCCTLLCQGTALTVPLFGNVRAKVSPGSGVL